MLSCADRYTDKLTQRQTDRNTLLKTITVSHSHLIVGVHVISSTTLEAVV